MEDEIDMYETDLAESMAIWCFERTEDDEAHVPPMSIATRVDFFLHVGYQ